MTTPTRNRTPFTLIELLTVMVIIMILVGILVPTVQTVRTRAMETDARTRVASLRTAISQFYSTYGHLPIPATVDSERKLTDAEYDVLITILSGSETSTPKQNPRGIVFLEKMVTDSDKPHEFQDPWGERLVVVLDQDYDNEITNGPFETVNSSAAIWSTGKNKDDEDGAGDDLNSWGGSQ